ncbi:MAG TPA: 16S rRNA (guanine(966)-N(2))-methyltransferase RsmD [Candidatus Dormibacteraeota bacterium]|jgi:16S rRNA (guanine(966)-N(2))-methyltransferase RsmD|nr:16S rRNA (guanine(966)-N(2))-methyltransferase RsmD [Candidatus Dormibacteraeota bacterium]
MTAAAQTRITAGQWRGRSLITPRHGREIRPTTSLVRQALFNILGDLVVDAAFVDLYAGAGTVGFEALSRGAKQVTFVERDRTALACIEQTAQKLGCSDRVRRAAADVVSWVRSRPRELDAAGVVYLDAPYKDDSVDEVLGLLGERPPALVVCEHHRARRLPETVGGLARVREATYGATRLTILRREDAAHIPTPGATTD